MTLITCILRLRLVDPFRFFWSLFPFQKKSKCVWLKTHFYILFGPFLNGPFWHMLKILLKMNLKYIENTVRLKYILKQTNLMW